MKKLISALLAFAVLFCFSSCGKKDAENKEKGEGSGILSGIFPDKEDKKEKTTTTTMPEEEASHVASKIEDGRFGDFSAYNDEEKEKIKEYVEKDGYTLEYNDDGSGTLSNEEGSWYVGKGWVDNEYTKGVPPIDFGTITMSSEAEESGGKFYIFLIRDATAYTANEYAEKVKAAGFADTGESECCPEAGVVSYAGVNSSGKRVEIAYSSYGFTVKIFINK